jgi:secretion/DNA translocation related TadE-like protein
MSRSRAGAARETGGASVLVAGAAAVVAAVTVVAVLIGAASHASARAAAAADLSALAAADAVRRSLAAADGADPCAVAAGIAAQNDAVLRDCRVDAGWNVSVVVEVAGPTLDRWSDQGVAYGAARTGPAPQTTGPPAG